MDREADRPRKVYQDRSSDPAKSHHGSAARKYQCVQDVAPCSNDSEHGTRQQNPARASIQVNKRTKDGPKDAAKSPGVQAPDETVSTKKVVEDEEVTRSSVLMTPHNIDGKPSKSFYIPRPQQHRRLRNTRHHQRHNTRQYCYWRSIPHHTPTGTIRVIGELSRSCAILIATRKGLAQPRRDRPKEI